MEIEEVEISDWSQLHKIMEENYKRTDGKQWNEFLIGLDHPLLQKFINLIDCPGLGDAALPQKVINQCKNADAVMYLISAEGEVKESVRRKRKEESIFFLAHLI